MTSNCPKCNLSIEHEDYLFEVQCSQCGTRYNPFMQMEAQNPKEDFKESSSAFAEIRAFGETLEEPASSSGSLSGILSDSENTGSKAAASTAPLRAEAQANVSDLALCFQPLATPPEDYRLLSPIALWIPLEGEQALAEGFQRLQRIASERGATAVLQVQWLVSPSGKGLALLGTPAKKQG